MTNPVVNFFYSFKGLRKLGKSLLANRTMYQPFHGGTICFNAVEFNYFWLNEKKCETMDTEVQDILLEISRNSELFIDIGANIGIMTLSIALRNPDISIKSYDPNKFVLQYLKKSVVRNNLQNRVEVINAAVADHAGTACMNFEVGVYSGFLSEKGTTVNVVDFNVLLKEHAAKKVLFKMDIEGFEKNLVPILVKEKNPNHCFVIEIHPKGLNDISDPEFVINELLTNNYKVTDAYGKTVNGFSDIADWTNVVCRYVN